MHVKCDVFTSFDPSAVGIFRLPPVVLGHTWYIGGCYGTRGSAAYITMRNEGIQRPF